MSKWLLHHCTTSTARLPSLVFCLAPATAALTNYGGRSVSVCLTVCPCVCLCVCFLMLMLKFTKCTTWRCHFTSCHLAVALPVSAFPPLLLPLPPSLSFSLRLVSSLRLFFIFILAFVFIDSQVVWLFHFSFGRKTFDLPPPPSHSNTRICTPAHTQHSFLAPSACHSHSFSRLLSVIGYQWLTRLSFSALYVYVMTIRIDILLRSAKFTQLLSQLPVLLPLPLPLSTIFYCCYC